MTMPRFVLFIMLVAGLICSCSPGANDTQDDNTTGMDTVLNANVSKITSVTSVATDFRNFQYYINANGKIISLKEQLIVSENGGNILSCKARAGVLFPSGSLIVQLATTSTEHRLQRAELTKFNSEKEYESQLIGYDNLLKDKSVQQADAIRRKLKISTGLAAAEQEIREADYELTKASIRAPFSGILADVKIQEGQQLKPGEELFRIYDPYALLLEVKVLEADVLLLKKGIPAEISALASDKIIYKGSIDEINPYVDANGMVSVKLKVESKSNGHFLLFPGMNCSATIKIPFGKTLIVPKEAVVMRNGRPVVFTVEGGKAKWNYVAIGRDNGKEIEIKEGLEKGQKVIISNNLQLAHDAAVKEVPLSDLPKGPEGEAQE